MRAVAVGFTDRNDRYPARGERIAAWVESYMADRGLSLGELAFRVKADKRDLRRLLNERSCGPRLNDALEEAFKWAFIEAVATPVVGADPLTSLEEEIAAEKAEIAARELRLARRTAASSARRSVAAGGLRLVAEEDRTWGASVGKRPGGMGEGGDR